MKQQLGPEPTPGYVRACLVKSAFYAEKNPYYPFSGKGVLQMLRQLSGIRAANRRMHKQEIKQCKRERQCYT